MLDLHHQRRRPVRSSKLLAKAWPSPSYFELVVGSQPAGASQTREWLLRRRPPCLRLSVTSDLSFLPLFFHTYMSSVVSLGDHAPHSTLALSCNNPPPHTQLLTEAALPTSCLGQDWTRPVWGRAVG